MDEIFGILKKFDKLIKIIYEVYTAWYQSSFFILYVWPTRWFLQVVLIEATESRKNPFEGRIDCVHFSARDLGRYCPGRSMFGKGGESLPLLQRPRGRGHSQKNWVGVCGPLPKTLTLFITKICDIPYPIYDLTKNSKPNLWPDPHIKILFQTCILSSSVVQTNFKLP